MAVRFLVALLLAFLAIPAAAQTVSPEALRRHIDVLASDSFEGREPGTEGEKKSIAYIARQMQALGLEPAGPQGSWYQPLEVSVRRPGDPTASVWQGKHKNRDHIELNSDGVILIGRSAHETLAGAPVAFAGHGAVIPARGIDQLAGADLTGAVALILYDAPDTPGFPSFAERVDAVAAHGAAAVIGIVGRDLPWPVVQRLYDAGQKRLAMQVPPPIVGAMSQAAAETLVQAAHRDFATLLAAPGPSFTPVPLRLRATFDVVPSIETIA